MQITPHKQGVKHPSLTRRVMMFTVTRSVSEGARIDGELSDNEIPRLRVGLLVGVI